MDKIMISHKQGKLMSSNEPFSLSPRSSDKSIGSSSLSATDSDSLRNSQSPINYQVMTDEQQSVESNGKLTNNVLTPTSKSPILIKYNYYDYNGSRQEQTNHDMNYFSAFNKQHKQQNPDPSRDLAKEPGKVQRQLSPEFKESLDQIVRNSQQRQQQQHQDAQQVTKSMQDAEQVQQKSSLDSDRQQLVARLQRRYKLSSYQQRCLRCQKTVYQMDKVGPLKDFTFYHNNCFKCLECGTKLTLKTYLNNQQSSGDQEVYCHRHCPKTGPGRLDNQSVSIRAALNAPKVFELTDHGALVGEAAGNGAAGARNVDSRALYIQHAVQQTRMQHAYRNTSRGVAASHVANQEESHSIARYLNGRLEYLEPKQKMLEMRHREEEDALFKAFELKWRQEESYISEQIKDEWQLELGKLLDKYKRQLSNISPTSQQVNRLSGQAAVASQLRQDRGSQAASKAMAARKPMAGSNGDMIKFERMNLEKTMTIKLDRKKETLKRKLKEFERQATAELVEKQSREMLALISLKLDEYKEEQKRKIDFDLEQFEAIDKLASQLDASMKLTAEHKNNKQQLAKQQVPSKSKLEAPLPRGQLLGKMDLYRGQEPDELFKEIDELAINVAREDQRTFTDLVHHLTRNCLTDVDKVRSIFRWITVKNLNTMQFDSSVKPDTPLGLLRGIKNGSESYHVLFKRLCSYAGLHCVVIKGYSKSAGYQPGVKFEGNRFKNSWNAVFVAGSWRFVQCNWGARHLVSVAVMRDKATETNGNQRGVSSEKGARRSPADGSVGRQQTDSLRYEYDDHYFLTDPDEFIYEFHPLAPEWQLLNSKPISLTEFEKLPFVRSLFFKYGLYFPQTNIESVLYTDSSGATSIKIGMPTHMVPSLIFHYNLKHYDSDQEHHEGVSLKRFVMQSVESGATSDIQGANANGMLSNIVSFRVHLPQEGAYILDIFANSTTPSQYITGEPMKFKSVCKFKIVAKNLRTVMIPLPDCASGEFGPMKATRLFGIIPITHESGLISVQGDRNFNKRSLEIQFRMTRPLLDFMASLHKNGHDERQLSKMVKIFVDGDIVYVSIQFPEDGQFGLDIYTRDVNTSVKSTNKHDSINQSSWAQDQSEPKKQLLTHCCKYLINVRSP